MIRELCIRKRKNTRIMKTKFLSIIALAAFGIVAAAACNKPEAEINIAEEVAGSYTGTT